MFLSKLGDAEKKAFVNLARIISMADGVFDETEVKMIECACVEANIPFDCIDLEKDEDYFIDIISKSSDSDKKKVLVELTGLVYADGVLDPAEKAIIDKLMANCNIDQNFFNKTSEVLSKYNSVVDELYGLVK